MKKAPLPAGLKTEIVPAVHRNNAGIIGAAALALAGDDSGASVDEGEDLAGTTSR